MTKIQPTSTECPESPESEVLGDIAKHLVGRKFVQVSYCSDHDAEGLYWDQKPICLTLDDGSILYPLADNEGNNGGALATTIDSIETIPTFTRNYE